MSVVLRSVCLVLLLVASSASVAQPIPRSQDEPATVEEAPDTVPTIVIAGLSFVVVTLAVANRDDASLGTGALCGLGAAALAVVCAYSLASSPDGPSNLGQISDGDVHRLAEEARTRGASGVLLRRAVQAPMGVGGPAEPHALEVALLDAETAQFRPLGTPLLPVSSIRVPLDGEDLDSATAHAIASLTR